MNLVIVESPTKAKTISKFLGRDYKIESSYGHVRDLPKSTMGIDIEDNFKPKYVIPVKARENVKKLKTLADKAELVYYATDEDREGEAIAWHLKEILKTKKKQTKRIAFHEITKNAVLEALKNPRDIDANLVDAQQARRILDRLVGYNLSPFLWKKVARGLSAGRVQSVAVRLIVEREREIKAFNKEEFWTIDAIFSKDSNNFESKLSKINDKALEKLEIKDEKQAKNILDELKGAKYFISNIEKKETKRQPHAPFITSTLQQEANRKLGFSAKQTMLLAQQLYEGIEAGEHGHSGLITYMRTDSTNLSKEFLSACKKHIKENFGEKYNISEPRIFAKKAKGAQEAHEAIRPTDINLTPEKIKSHLDDRQFKLYDLIWRRALASQMQEAIINSTSVDILDEAKKYNFHSTGSQIKFDGFMKVYMTAAKENILPALNIDDKVIAEDITPNQHFTEPPPRYTEASLVKILEEYGIGRPSTYAPTISTIIDRGYIEREEKKLVPKDMAFVVNDLLVEHFPNIVDYEFTANMEEDLDKIAEGEKEWEPVIKKFYTPFAKTLKEKNISVEKKVEQTDEKCEKCGEPLLMKYGRFGKFLACSKYPECKFTKNIVEEKIDEKTGKPIVEEKKDYGKCEKCGGDMELKTGRFGQFLGCANYPDCKNIKSIKISTGAKCPACGKGELIEKKTKTKRTFYGCETYPKCDFALWQKPTGETCPKCQSLLVYAAGDKIKCSSKECDFEKEQVKN